MKTAKKVPLTMRALTQRINRKLAQDDQQLKKSVGAKLRQDVGEYYVLSTRMNAVMKMDVDPESLGRKLGILHDWECVVD